MLHLKHHHRHVLGRGFTLLELLLFISIAAILLSALAAFLGMVLQSRVKQQTIVEVEEQAVQVVEQIAHDIRNASSITSPAVGTTGSSLSLTGTSSTLWNVSGGQLKRTLGSGTPLELTSSGLIVSNVQFTNASKPQTNGIVRFQFTLERLNPPGRNEYDYTQTFYGSTALR